MTSTTGNNGRLGNQIIRNIARCKDIPISDVRRSTNDPLKYIAKRTLISSIIKKGLSKTVI